MTVPEWMVVPLVVLSSYGLLFIVGRTFGFITWTTAKDRRGEER